MNNLQETVNELAGNFSPEETGGRRPEVDEGEKVNCFFLVWHSHNNISQYLIYY